MAHPSMENDSSSSTIQGKRLSFHRALYTVQQVYIWPPNLSYNQTTMCILPPTSPHMSLGLVAGEGLLPVRVAENAKQAGWSVKVFALDKGNVSAFKKNATAVHKVTPGLLEKNLKLLADEEIHHLVFAGKVNKWMLFRDPRLDKMALQVLSSLIRKNDDAVMLKLIELLEAQSIEILRQTDFLQDQFIGPGLLTRTDLTLRDVEDMRYGFELAKEMGRLDVGQSLVMKDGMVVAVEALEGTDVCLKRAGQLTRGKGGIVIKVAKPEQDLRFDVPTVGLRTLKVMKSVGLKVLATEANRTLFLDPEEMVAFANKNQMSIVSLTTNHLSGTYEDILHSLSFIAPQGGTGASKSTILSSSPIDVLAEGGVR